ncbi:amidohydrolase [Iodobacter fluviatilis]|uniref:Amidohydrolase n=1 Tax=Iodobacter fluviatilis TaxID=537 RepID=A0A7G3G5W5_9NEIS|nr:amidohydrolase [Iodobacter fluviatilis]QBC42584.1 amidohydrolase [Iodobacter fluviatilis]
MKRLSLIASCLLIIGSPNTWAQSSRAILSGGTIYSADLAHPHPEAVGIADGRIVAVGSRDAVEQQMGKTTPRIDLAGKFLMPGLIDSHVHAAFAGFQEMTVHFPSDLTTAEQIRSFASQATKDAKLMQGNVQLFTSVSLEYWNHIELLEQVFNSAPYRNIPVVLAGSDAHTGWANQAMLKQAGLLASVEAKKITAPNDGFARNKDGRLNGFASEGGWDLILKAMPKVSDAQIGEAIKLAACQLNSVGITAWMDPVSNIRPLSPAFSAEPTRKDTGLLPAYTELARKGELNGHVSALALVSIHAKPAIINDVMALKQQFSGTSDVKLIGIKILQDGVIEFPSQTAKLSQPYLNRPGYSGQQDLQATRFNELIRQADAQYLIAHFHAIGDRAVGEALDAIDYARQHNPDHSTLHSITHLQIMSPESVARFKPLNVAASMQFLWSGKDFSSTSLLENIVPAPLLTRLYPAGSLIRSGAIVAGASDWPVSSPNPMLAMYTALTRQGDLGELAPADEKINRSDVLQAYTLNAAKLIAQDKNIGSISIGKSADFVLLDKNLEQIAPKAFPQTKVLWTMFKGRKVFEAERCQ